MNLKSQTSPILLPESKPFQPHGLSWEEFHKAEGKSGKLPNNGYSNGGGAKKKRPGYDRNRRKSIVSLLNKLGPMAARDIAAKFGIAEDTCRKQCVDMVRAGVLISQREGRGTLYSVRKEQSATERLRDAMQEAGE